MIVNVFSVVLLFVDAVCLGLALYVLAVAIRQLRRDADRERFEMRAVLGLLAGITLVGLRFVSWPLLYATLVSFVPSIEGAMCVYGVTQAHPVLSVWVQALKPIILWIAGAWLLLDRLDRRSRTAPLTHRTTILLALVAALVLVETPLEMALLVGTRATFVVTCCTTVADVAARPASMIPTALLGEGYHAALTAAFFGIGGVLALLAFLASFRRTVGGRTLGLIPLLALVSLPIGWLAAVEILAPRWMGLPYHHCFWCFLAFRDAPVAIGAYVVSVFLVFWAAFLPWAGRADEIREAAARMARLAWRWAGILLLASLALAAFHLFVPAHKGPGPLCAQDRVPIKPGYEVTITFQDGSTVTLCNATCALLYLKDRSAKVSTITVHDETTGAPMDSEAAFYVESEVFTHRESANRIHVFASLAEAERHIADYRGRGIPSPFAEYRK